MYATTGEGRVPTSKSHHSAWILCVLNLAIVETSAHHVKICGPLIPPRLASPTDHSYRDQSGVAWGEDINGHEELQLHLWKSAADFAPSSPALGVRA
ncbi:hypothetical protein BD410DRAFT_785636 [Rickenella mellea]|uniref:Uncharacterized protein n=1 Tax=Rickenella mellea TaxID=50990 RepID=A0A4Y7QC00_9AGAM|nr:hypothetical protein BD410DRAFT_785636 [Rickenella mellea]